jgi:predicted nucleic acid-binding protein
MELQGLYDTALVIAEQNHLGATYDAIYVAVAKSTNDELWTDDRRLLRALGGRLPFVKWIGDYPVT